MERSRQILAKRGMTVGKIQGAQLEFPALPVGQDESHPVQPHRLSDPRGNGLDNIPQFEVGDHAVVQVEDEPQLGSFLLQLSTHQLGLGEIKPIIDGQGGIVADQRKQADSCSEKASGCLRPIQSAPRR